MTTMLPLAEVRDRLSPLVSSVEATHERMVITKNGRPAAVLISCGDLESLQETLEILSDPELVQEIRGAWPIRSASAWMTFGGTWRRVVRVRKRDLSGEFTASARRDLAKLPERIAWAVLEFCAGPWRKTRTGSASS